MPITMQVSANELLAGACFQTEQARLNAYVQATTVVFPGTASVFNYGSTTPTVDQREFPWYRLNADGTPDNFYTFYNGQWIRPHPIPPSYEISYIYKGSFDDLETFDGGDDGTLGVASGPMWEPDPDFYDRLPMGAGDPDGTPFFTPGSSGGARDKILATSTTPVGTGTPITVIIENNFSILNPYFTAIYIKRTARIFYVA